MTHATLHTSYHQLATLVLVGLLSGCVAYELDYSDIDYAEFQIIMDWSFCSEQMMHDGATVLFYPATGQKPQTVLIAGTTEKVRLKKGSYSIVGFNQTFGDFSYIRFRGQDNYNTLEAYARHLDEPVPTSEQKIYEPELLAAASIDSFFVTDEMIESTRSKARSGNTKATLEILIRPLPVVAISAISLWVNGLEHVRPDMAFGTMRGMAEGVFMATRRNNKVKSAQPFPFTLHFPPTSSSDGQLLAAVYSFGMIDEVMFPEVEGASSIRCYAAQTKATNETKQSEEPPPDSYPTGNYFLDIDLTLKNKEKTKINPSFDISRQVHIDSKLGTIILVEVNNPDNPDDPPPVPIPPVPHDEETSSGFDAEVGDWGDEEIIDIPM